MNENTLAGEAGLQLQPHYHSACEGGKHSFSGHKEMKGHGQRILRFSSKI